MNEFHEAVRGAILEHAGVDLKGELEFHRAGGGCIHESSILKSGEHRYFVKVNGRARLDMFEAERDALEAMKSAAAIRVPEPIATGTSGARAFLIMEALDLRGTGDSAAMGRQLAALHQNVSPDGTYGWSRDNYIGEAPQMNPRETNWVGFFREHRLRYQMELARRRGLHLKKGDQLLDRLEEIMDGHQPLPSLLHGDLWSGNAGWDEHGQPVLFDPASYYGDGESDIAFTHMFGGFPASFYRGYQEILPLKEGHHVRAAIYLLYHQLNHYHHFGGHYGVDAKNTIEALIQGNP